VTAPRDGDRVRVTLEGEYRADPEGSARIVLDGDERVWIGAEVLAASTIEVLMPTDYPGLPGTVWASREGVAFLVVTNGLGRMMLSDSRGVWHSPELIAEQCGPMRRVEIPAEDVARNDVPADDGGAEA